MARFSEQFIQQVAQATDIVDLIGTYMALKKKGREFVGLCPFHDDKNPSMCVVPAKQIFHCFVCGSGGGVYAWVMKYEKLAFPEAVKALAERARIPLPRETENYTPIPAGLGKDDLAKVLVFAADFFQRQLLGPGGASALEYARGRGLSDESIKRFGIGFAPDFWDSLLRSAMRDGIGENQLLAAGLVIQREGEGRGCYDRFRNRLMFPIYDAQGKVIAFGGRALSPDDRAKYMNSPESIMFDKSSQLFALNWSREGISKSGQAVVVEGYMDAVIPLQGGLDNVVATLGTALTERHVRLLGRYAREVVLVFDADAAGQAAAQRGLEMFITQQMHVRVATIPQGKDPCDYVLGSGPEAMKELIAQAPDALAYAWSRRWQEYQQAGGNLADRRAVVEEFLKLVASTAAYGTIDEVRRGQLLQHIGHILNMSPADLATQVRRLARTISRASAPQAAGPVGANAPASLDRAERDVLEVLLNRPELFDTICERISPSDFTDPRMAAAANCVWGLGARGLLALDQVLAAEEMAPFGALLAGLTEAGERRGNFDQTLAGAVERMIYSRTRRETEAAKKTLVDDEVLRQITDRASRADQLRHPKIQ